MTTSKRPDDKPYDFNLDAVKVEKDLPPFRFPYKGEQFEMKHREYLDQIPILEANESGGDATATLTALRTALGKEQWEKIRKLGLFRKQMNALLNAYDEFCGAEQGESSGSTDS